MQADLTIGAPEAPEVVEGDDAAGGVDDVAQADELVAVAPVSEAQVRALLTAGGRGLNVLTEGPFTPGVWRFTDDELDDLTPPLTRVVNRRPALARMVERGDEAAVGIMLATYVGRNLDTMQQGKKIAAAASAAARNPDLEAHRAGQREAGDAPSGARPAAGGPGRRAWPGSQDGAGRGEAPDRP